MAAQSKLLQEQLALIETKVKTLEEENKQLGLENKGFREAATSDVSQLVIENSALKAKLIEINKLSL